MNKKLIAIIVALVIVTAGIGLYAMKGLGCFETAEKLDLIGITKQCMEDHEAATHINSSYVSKKVEVEGAFKSLKLVSQMEANYLGLEGKNLHLLGLVYMTNIKHRGRLSDSKPEDTPVVLQCYLAEGQEKKIQGKKKEGDNVIVSGTVMEISRDTWAGAYITITLKDCKVAK